MKSFAAACAFCEANLRQLLPQDLEQDQRKMKVLQALDVVQERAVPDSVFCENAVDTYRGLRQLFTEDEWVVPLVRRLLYDYWVCYKSARCKEFLFESVMNYLNNTPIIFDLKECYPLHQAVLDRKLYVIRKLCIGGEPNYFFVDVDAPDPLGNTALMLAVKLKFFQEAFVLIDHGADPKYRFKNEPCAIEQALAMRELNILRVLVVGYQKNLQLTWVMHSQALSEQLLRLPDFSVKLRWECASKFIPFVKKFTPSDCYVIYKKGQNLRVDLSLVGWENLKVRRGSISLLYLGAQAKLLLVDHDTQQSKDLVGDLTPQQLEKYTQSED